MNETQTYQWPPREGLRFFALWMAGLLVGKLCGTALLWSNPVRRTGILPPSWFATYFTVFTVITLALGVWQAWLLFGSRRRGIAWACILALPVIPAFLSFLWRDTSSTWMYATLCLVAVVQCGLLFRVRERNWLWLIVAIACFSLEQPVNRLVRSGVTPWVRMATVRLGFSRQFATSISSNAAYITTNVLPAIALAWWMPPLRRKAAEPDESREFA